MTQELYTPRKHQADIEGALARFSVLVCHRRFGKTVLSVNRLIRAARETDRPDWRGAYIAPLYRQAKTVVWDELKRYCGLGRDDCTVKFNETELRADFENGARIRLFGANNPDSLRGMYLDGVVFDEVAQMPHRVWAEVIRPALSDRKGWAMFIGTPRGKNALYEIWEKGMVDPDWFTAMYRASETGIIYPDELNAAAREMSPEEYEQEFECSFTAAIRGAYFGQLMSDADRERRVTRVPHDPSMPVHTAWDLGMSDSTSIWFVQAKPGGTYAVIDYYEASGEGLDHYAKVLDKKGINTAPISRLTTSRCANWGPENPGWKWPVPSASGSTLRRTYLFRMASMRCEPFCPDAGSTRRNVRPASRQCAITVVRSTTTRPTSPPGRYMTGPVTRWTRSAILPWDSGPLADPPDLR